MWSAPLSLVTDRAWRTHPQSHCSWPVRVVGCGALYNSVCVLVWRARLSAQGQGVCAAAGAILLIAAGIHKSLVPRLCSDRGSPTAPNSSAPLKQPHLHTHPPADLQDRARSEVEAQLPTHLVLLGGRQSSEEGLADGALQHRLEDQQAGGAKLVGPNAHRWLGGCLVREGVGGVGLRRGRSTQPLLLLLRLLLPAPRGVRRSQGCSQMLRVAAFRSTEPAHHTPMQTKRAPPHTLTRRSTACVAKVKAKRLHLHRDPAAATVNTTQYTTRHRRRESGVVDDRW